MSSGKVYVPICCFYGLPQFLQTYKIVTDQINADSDSTKVRTLLEWISTRESLYSLEPCDNGFAIFKHAADNIGANTDVKKLLAYGDTAGAISALGLAALCLTRSYLEPLAGAKIINNLDDIGAKWNGTFSFHMYEAVSESGSVPVTASVLHVFVIKESFKNTPRVTICNRRNCKLEILVRKTPSDYKIEDSPFKEDSHDSVQESVVTFMRDFNNYNGLMIVNLQLGVDLYGNEADAWPYDLGRRSPLATGFVRLWDKIPEKH